jgi:hypothetical protein
MKYNSAPAVLQALKRGEACGVIIYEGPSKIDGKPVVAIANRITQSSANTKTGAMVQTFIMRQDIAPHKALKTGDDSSVCGNCPLRPIEGNATRCYVRVYQAPLSTWNAYKRGRYLKPGIDFPTKLLPALFEGLAVRFGSYGDPYAVPVKHWLPMAQKARTWTGYSHQWRKAGKTLAKLCMASADTVADVKMANAKGWRTFRVKKFNEPMQASEFSCPASKEAGQRTDCANCGLCKGASIQARNPVINDHGALKARGATI